MQGSKLVGAFRAKLNSPAADRRSHGERWRKVVFAACGVVSLAAFGNIVVQAGDSSGVYDVARQYQSARGTPRFQLPQIFMPARPATRALSYAPILPYAAPQSVTTQSTGKRSVDRARREERIREDRVREDKSRKIALRSVIKSGASSRDKDDEETESLDAYLTNRMSYCVRTCDGFFFPVGNPDSGGIASHEAACARACPAAETSVFVAASGSRGIDDAVDRRGKRYQAMRTAFNYRSQLDSACTCNGAPGASRNYSLMSDFTLRAGDLVMSREGLKVYRGSEDVPHRRNQFSNADNANLSASERRWAQSTEASSIRGMQGAKVSASLQARIEAQLRAARTGQRAAVAQPERAPDRTIQVTDGRQMRYVGPDKSTALR